MAKIRNNITFTLTQEEKMHFAAVFNTMYELINMVEDGSKIQMELQNCTHTIAKIVTGGKFDQ